MSCTTNQAPSAPGDTQHFSLLDIMHFNHGQVGESSPSRLDATVDPRTFSALAARHACAALRRENLRQFLRTSLDEALQITGDSYLGGEEGLLEHPMNSMSSFERRNRQKRDDSTSYSRPLKQ